jgi:transposase-like protein
MDFSLSKISDPLYCWKLSTTTLTLVKLQLPPEYKCPECYNSSVKLRLSSAFEIQDRYSGHFICTKRCCKYKKSIYCDTIFEKCKISSATFFELAYRFCALQRTSVIASECVISKKIASRWLDKLRHVQKAIVLNNVQQIGGIGKQVEIDETHVKTFRLRRQNKNHEGQKCRKRGKIVKQCWCFGGIDRDTGDVFCSLVEKRDETTLFNLIKTHIAPGTTIYSDSWKAYHGITLKLSPQYNFKHHMVNHSKAFINVDDVSINTQKIERQWRILKSLIPNEIHNDEEKLSCYIFHYLYYVKFQWSKKSVNERFQILCKNHITRVYPGPIKNLF